MTEEGQLLLGKIFFVFRKLDACHLLLNEGFGDDVSRCVFRFVFIQIDNFSKLAGRVKNLLVQERILVRADRRELEHSIAKLIADYEPWYAQIRDKFSAHNQPVPLHQLLMLWTSIDRSTLELLMGDIKEIEHLFSHALGDGDGASIPDYSPLDAARFRRLSPPTSVRVANDRLAVAKPGAVAMLALNSAIEATQVVTSIIDFLEIDFAVTLLANEPETIYQREVFDIGWLLVTIDLCSLIDNLFNGDAYTTPMFSLWDRESIKGAPYLHRLNAERDSSLEEQLRSVRNRCAAHIDDSESIENLVKEFEALDLTAVHSYAHMLILGFYAACRADIRTLIFSRNNVEFPDSVITGYSAKPFADS